MTFMEVYMLEGITVLSKSTVSPLVVGIPLLVIGALVALVGGSLCILCLMEHDYGACAIPFVLFIIGLVGLICGARECREKPKVEYKVTIDDEVDFKEFNDRYTIVDQDGEIYTITEKESK